jgi:predicted aconitase
MIRLTPEDRRVLDGEYGRLRQRALENTVSYAEVLGAEELCVVTKATVFCGRHGYLDACGEEDFDAVFSKAQLGSDDTIPFDSVSSSCQTQSCVAPCESVRWAEFSQSEKLFELNGHYLERARDAGVTIVGSCSPYLNGWIPIPGEHFVTTESGMTILGNSLWGACCNSDGIEAAFWSAICGRTPLWGKHTREGRLGNVRVRVGIVPESRMDWDILGKAIGDRLPVNSVPVITGDFRHASFNNIRQFVTAIAVSSNCEMCHIPGVTYDFRTEAEAFSGLVPEDSIDISSCDMARTYEKICSPGEGRAGLVSLGCPHYDIHQVKMAVDRLKGKKAAPGVNFQIWTTYPIRTIAEANGYLGAIRDFGGDIYTGTCPTTIGNCFLDQFEGLVFDSVKQGGSVRSSVNAPIYIADMENCVDAAISGVWKENYRWKSR